MEMSSSTALKWMKIAFFLTHTPCPAEDVAYVAEKLRAQFPDTEILETDAGAVVGSHCGPGTLGILFIEKQQG